MSAPQPTPPLVIPLISHEAIIAALVLCASVDDDNIAVVMVKGYGGASYDKPDNRHYTGICLADYDLDEVRADDTWFDDYTCPELWLYLDRALPRCAALALKGPLSRYNVNPYPKQPGFGLRVANARRSLRRLGVDCLTNIYTRGFDSCFEMGDGAAVVWALMHAALAGDHIVERGIRAMGDQVWPQWLAVYRGEALSRDDAHHPRLL